ncbi:MAG: hypothetical protein J0L64_28525 [Acidobacteria bacterium]|nr:hypothetical protein [Acidobacteriota bacterium]
MQTLGLSDSTPRTEGRLKSLFWPTLTNGADVDYITYQGFWLCTFIAILSAVVATLGGFPLGGILDGLFFFLCGVGIRRRSLYPAVIALTVYFLSTFVLLKHTDQGFGVGRILGLALLLSNTRAIYLASRWPASELESLVAPISPTVPERFAALAQHIWPAGRYLLVLLAILEFAFITLALLAPRAQT